MIGTEVGGRAPVAAADNSGWLGETDGGWGVKRTGISAKQPDLAGHLSPVQEPARVDDQPIGAVRHAVGVDRRPLKVELAADVDLMRFTMAWKRNPPVRLKLLLALELADRQVQAVTSTTVARDTLNGAEQAGRMGEAEVICDLKEEPGEVAAACPRPSLRSISHGGTGRPRPTPAILIDDADVLGVTWPAPVPAARPSTPERVVAVLPAQLVTASTGRDRNRSDQLTVQDEVWDGRSDSEAGSPGGRARGGV
jgi:hypothetical protein